MTWRTIPISLTELCIDTTLRCGQSFRWKKSSPDTYSCAIHGRLISLRQDSTHLHYRSLLPAPLVSTLEAPLTPRTEDTSDGDSMSGVDDNEAEAFLRHYLNLGPNLGKLYEAWAASDGNFRKKAPRFTGVRILKQDAWEALVGFICSSNNNIARISQMMDKLCAHYGPLIGHIDGTPYYDMPAPLALTNPRVEGHLRDLGFGYRAKYLYQTAVMITREEDGWLDKLRNPERPVIGQVPKIAGEMQPGGREGYIKAHESLLALQGVGPKVADCVCLMGLGWGEAVPVDTHVWQIAQRDYKFGKGKHRSLTKATYDAVGDHFRSLWGPEAGWAHSVLFTADLRAFSERLKVKIKTEDGGIKTETLAVKGINYDTMNVKKENVVVKDLKLGVVDVKSEITAAREPSYDEVNVKEETIVFGDGGVTPVVKHEITSTAMKPPREALVDELSEDAPASKSKISLAVVAKRGLADEEEATKGDRPNASRTRSKRQKRG